MSNEETRREIEDLRARLDALSSNGEEHTPLDHPAEKTIEPEPEGESARWARRW